MLLVYFHTIPYTLNFTVSAQRMHQVITMQRLASAASSAAAGAGAVGVGVAKAGIQIPSWPALLLAGTSIISKEWLYRVTKRVGVLLNSQILIANAWHHRSDAFSSVLSLVSIAIAITMPGLLIADSAAGE